jgi:hypothetical protein
LFGLESELQILFVGRWFLLIIFKPYATFLQSQGYNQQPTQSSILRRRDMLNKLLFHRFPNVKSWLTRLQYEMVSTFDKDKNAIFMNFGYTAHHKGKTNPLELKMRPQFCAYYSCSKIHCGITWML